MQTQSLPLKEKIGYGFGDFASSLFWKIFTMFLMIFYTDVFKLEAADVGTMLLLTRLWDGLNDPIMGMVADRTNTLKGKFRPYLLWIAVPFGLIGVLTFTTPEFSYTGKLIYAYVTYTLMMMVYTAINVPYSSLMGVMTDNAQERTSLASFRFIGAYSGGIFITATIPHLLDFFRNSNHSEADSYQYTVAIYAIIAILFFIMTYKWTKERLKPIKEKTSISKDLKDLAQNAQWFIMLGTGISVLIFASFRDGATMHYFKYLVKDQSVPFFGEVGWEKLSSAYLTIWLATNMLGVVIAKPLAGIMGKKKTFMMAMVISSVLSLSQYWIEPNQITLLFVLNIFIGISAGIVFPLIWSMYADIVDYSEYKTGRRATGLVYSSSSMSQKMGGSLAGAITGWILTYYGFKPDVEQTASSLEGIRLLLSVYPAIGAAVSVGFLAIYKLSDNYMATISQELEKSR